MFRCKQFTIDDSGATMKVGTDAMLLGALATPRIQPTHILDIGTGCGILSLMMAQRFSAIIDAIDIDAETTAVADANFHRSQWSSRLNAKNISLQKFTKQFAASKQHYDLIVSNPPYFSNSLRNEDPRRRLARHDDNLDLDTLFRDAARLLSSDGTLAIILPTVDSERAIVAAEKHCLQLKSCTDICNHPDDAPKRSILQFIVTNDTLNTIPTKNNIAIRNFDNTYTTEYQTLTFPFLL